MNSILYDTNLKGEVVTFECRVRGLRENEQVRRENEAKEKEWKKRDGRAS